MTSFVFRDGRLVPKTISDLSYVPRLVFFILRDDVDDPGIVFLSSTVTIDDGTLSGVEPQQERRTRRTELLGEHLLLFQRERLCDHVAST